MTKLAVTLNIVVFIFSNISYTMDIKNILNPEKSKEYIHSKRKIEKVSYSVKCREKDCNKKIKLQSTKNLKKDISMQLAINLIKHKYSKKHNSELFESNRSKVKKETQKINKNGEVYFSIKCADCGSRLFSENKKSLLYIWIKHITATITHNETELRETIDYIKTDSYTVVQFLEKK